jgi:hypothetical protein
LDYGQDRNLVNLSQSISTCWLIDPFINRVEVGDMISLTAFYFMTPVQKFVESRCISPLQGAFVAFDIVKVNPFNQMVDADPKLSSLLFSASSSKQVPSRGLTLENIRLHQEHITAN